MRMVQIEETVTIDAGQSNFEINSLYPFKQSIWVVLYMLLEYFSFLF